MLLMLAAGAVRAQSVEFSSSLDLTDGYAREGTYLPVRLRVTNRTQQQITGVHLTSGGPIDVRAPLELAPGAREETVLPVLFLGGTPTLALEFLGGEKVVDRATIGPLAVRKLGDDEALVAVEKSETPLDEAGLTAVAALLGAKTVHTVTLSREMVWLVQRFSAADGILANLHAEVGGRGAVIRRDATGRVQLGRFPLGTETPVQPETYKLLASPVWPGNELARLWLWLGLVCLAVAAAGVWISRRRAVVATLVMVILAAGATGLILWLGELHRARVTEAVVLYYPTRTDTMVEKLVLLESRGGATARLAWHLPATMGLPIPVLASAADVFRPMATLRLGPEPEIEARRAQVVVHFCTGMPQGSARPAVNAAALLAVAGAEPETYRAALSVVGDRGIDAAGESRPLNGWAAEWRASANADMAFAGRSLAWWVAQRQEGGGEWVLAWTWAGAFPPVFSVKPDMRPTLLVWAFPAAGR